MSITVNGQKIEGFSFPGGERHINVGQIGEALTFRVESKIRSSDDLMDTMLICDALYRKAPHIPITLCLPYLPYARQDRVCASGDPFSLNVISRMLNSLSVQQVVTFDPHNIRECAKSINAFRVIPNTQFVEDIIDEVRPDFLICPDAGARFKYAKIWEMLPTTFCRKNRDPLTGKLSGFSLDKNSFMPNRYSRGLVVDDICDGGGTFLGIADLFEGKVDLHLTVSHGIFSKGLRDLFSKFSTIHTTDSFCTLREMTDSLFVYKWNHLK